jgi:5-methylcytosine-specific restriction protein B
MKQAMKEYINPEKTYTMAAHATWQFVHEMKPGDIVFAKKGRSTVIGRGVVMSDYEFDDSRDDNKNVRKVNWTHKGEWPHPGQAAMKTLTDITFYTDYVEKLNVLFESDEVDDVEAEEVSYPSYSKENFLDQVFMDEKSYDTLSGLVLNKKNVILQGAPGVGKTYAAKRLAYSIMGVKDPNRVMMVQFHQSYSYEDFIMGFRPSEKGFELKNEILSERTGSRDPHRRSHAHPVPSFLLHGDDGSPDPGTGIAAGHGGSGKHEPDAGSGRTGKHGTGDRRYRGSS